MISILVALAIIISGMICSLYMWTKVNNNALNDWNNPIILFGAFCLHWGMFAMMLFTYFSMYKLKIVKWCCCTPCQSINHDAVCGGCKRYTYKLIEISKK
jgi:tellurite resistance protein TehA-like permease